MEEHKCIIDDLLLNTFSSKTFEEKLQIVTNGRPCPKLLGLTTKHKGKKEEYIRHFSDTQYNAIPWLTGSEKLNKLFCWPCLLFSSEKGVWTKTGFSDLSHLSVAQQRHERSQAHVESFLKYKMFGKQRIDVLIDSQHKANITQHNELVKKNRDVLKRLIDAVCFLAKQELPLRGHDESHDSLNKGNYLKLLEALRTYDPLLDSHLKTATVFRGTSPAIQNDIIQALSDVILDYIKNEVRAATFASIMLDESSDVHCRSQLSTVLRYVKDGVPYERFVGFVDVSSDRTSDGLFTHVTAVVEEYHIGERLVGQTYDGASVMSGHLNGLQTKVLEAYPKALFTHCYAHVLNLVLQQSLSNIKQCKIFFQTLSGLPSFFSKSSRRSFALEEFVQKKLPSVAPTRWNFSSRLVHTVKEYREPLTEFFKNVVDKSNEWDVDSVVKARGFHSFLNEFNTKLMLEIFSKLFSYTDVLYNILQGTSVDIMYCHQKVSDTVKQLQRDRQDGFDFVWNSTTSDSEVEPSTKRARRDIGRDFYRRLYFEIVDNLVEQIQTRYGSISKLSFFHLLGHQKYDNYKNTFPDELLESLKSVYGSVFDYIRLKSELTVVYASDEFRNMAVFELAKFIKTNDLASGFKEVYTLAELILTIPSTTSSVERSFSALKRIHTYCRCMQSQDRMSGLSVISIEKEVLQTLRCKDSFYEEVIERFLCKERRLELMYK